MAVCLAYVGDVWLAYVAGFWLAFVGAVGWLMWGFVAGFVAGLCRGFCLASARGLAGFVYHSAGMECHDQMEMGVWSNNDENATLKS